MLDYNNLKLTIDLVPATVWFSSVYQIYKKVGRQMNGIKLKMSYIGKKVRNVGYVVQQAGWRLTSFGSMMIKTIFRSL